MDVKMPDGTIINNVPDGITQTELLARYQKSQQPQAQAWMSPDSNVPPMQKPQTLAEKIASAMGRDAGLLGRFALQGVAAPVTMGSDIVGMGLGAITGKEPPPSLGGMVSDTLTSAGFPVPRTPGERLVGDILEGAVGGGGVGKMGAKIVGAAAGAGAGGAAGATREVGLPVPFQVGAGLVGGLAGGSAARALTKPALVTPPILQDIAEGGAENVAALPNLRSSIQSAAKRDSEKLFGVIKDGKKVRPGLFDKAEAGGNSVFIDSPSLRSFATDIRKQAEGKVGKAPAELLNGVANKLDDLIDRQGGINAGGLVERAKPTMNEIQSIRRELSALSSTGTVEASVAGKLAKDIDNYLLDTRGKITGDPKNIDLWNKAITGRKEFAQKFEQPQAIAKALTDASNETIEQIFVGSGGAALNKELSKVYSDTLKAIPAAGRQDAGFQLRQAIVNRMVKNAAQSSDSADGFSAMRMSNQINNFKKNNQSMWRNFPTEERDTLTRLEHELRGVAQGGAINKVYTALERFLSRKAGANVELPRTLKPKTIVTVDDLVELTNVRPTQPIRKSIAVGMGVERKNNNK